MQSPDPNELVLRDLIDTLIQENVCGVADVLTVTGTAPEPTAVLAAGEHWCRVDLGVDAVVFRGRDGGALQRYRFSRGPVWHCGMAGRPTTLSPGEVLAAVTASHANDLRVADMITELRDAVDHAATTFAGRRRLSNPMPSPGGLLAGERLAATRNRPFHPTSRAAAGWTAADLERYGPMRPSPLGLDWVAVRRDHLRRGSGVDSNRLEHLLLDGAELELLTEATRQAGAPPDEYQPLPVHPWQSEHLLAREYAAEFDTRALVPLIRGLGRFQPTASLRTLTTVPESARHLKLPLGVATLGAARLLPPRYMDNGERAQQTVTRLLERDSELGALVRVCDERTWCGWRDPGGDDEFADRPGHLAAQIRTYPDETVADSHALTLPMAALAAHEWDVLGPALAAAGFDPSDPVGLFRVLADAFCLLGIGFLRHGVLPEVHGQNVVVVLCRGAVRRFVLRDHDTLRLFGDWMRAADVPDPGYRIKPGAAQSLKLDSASALVSYLQTLGFQVNLYGIADALARHHGLDEQVFWAQVRSAVSGALERIALPAPVADVLDAELLRAPEWPSRQVLYPLLRRGRSCAVSMPAATGHVPNPLVPMPAAVC